MFKTSCSVVHEKNCTNVNGVHSFGIRKVSKEINLLFCKVVKISLVLPY